VGPRTGLDSVKKTSGFSIEGRFLGRSLRRIVTASTELAGAEVSIKGCNTWLL
jgi:hypothetical protein